MFFDYTTNLRDIIENFPINEDLSLTNRQVIENGRKVLFNFDYPMFDESYKKIFETNFIRRFYMRQIGFETVGLFQFNLETWLLINMPYFNKLFESEMIDFDPLSNMVYDEKHNRKLDKKQSDAKTNTGTTESDMNRSSNVDRVGTLNNETEGSSSASNENIQDSNINGSSEKAETTKQKGKATDDTFNRNLESNTPDSRLAITTNDGSGVIEYASLIKENKDQASKTSESDGANTSNEASIVSSTAKSSDNTNVSNKSSDQSNSSDTESEVTKNKVTQTDNKNEHTQSDINTLEEYVTHRVGKIGSDSYSKMVREYRDTFMRIENQIFNEMNQLFMLVY